MRKSIGYESLVTRCVATLIGTAMLVAGLVSGVDAKANDEWRLTILVNEGHGHLNGHVFVGLSAGARTSYRGFYPAIKILGPVSLGSGEVRDDGALAADGWDVKKTYVISREAYMRVLDFITNWNERGRPWGLRNHCGDFAETIARAAGIEVELPRQVTGRNRPALWGRALRSQGCVVNE